MARVLLLGSRHADQDRAVLEQLRSWAVEAGHQPVLASDATEKPLAAVRAALESADACVAVLDGSPLDAATAWLVAFAYAGRRPILGLRSDRRGDVPAEIRASLTDLVKVKSWQDPDAKAKVGSFLGGIRVFAGALVRDAVPKMIKDQGQELKFRQVAEQEYPRVLKRKLVETAQRLEEADFGVEQEEIADVLELLETLINIRKYDKESLRSIKEGKWRKRGGFQKGFLLEEDPVASSR
jgi:predicted house-cleaning noncanonical NTP pyrophosphatase (MazG superfamily)